MKIEIFNQATELIKRAKALTVSINRLEAAPPRELQLHMHGPAEVSTINVWANNEDTADFVGKIHKQVLEDMKSERKELEIEFTEL